MARIIKRVLITDDRLFLDGDEFPFHLEERGPTIVNHPGNGIRVLMLPVLIFDDETEINDRRTSG